MVRIWSDRATITASRTHLFAFRASSSGRALKDVVQIYVCAFRVSKEHSSPYRTQFSIGTYISTYATHTCWNLCHPTYIHARCIRMIQQEELCPWYILRHAHRVHSSGDSRLTRECPQLRVRTSYYPSPRIIVVRLSGLSRTHPAGPTSTS